MAGYLDKMLEVENINQKGRGDFNKSLNTLGSKSKADFGESVGKPMFTSDVNFKDMPHFFDDIYGFMRTTMTSHFKMSTVQVKMTNKILTNISSQLADLGAASFDNKEMLSQYESEIVSQIDDNNKEFIKTLGDKWDRINLSLKDAIANPKANPSGSPRGSFGGPFPRGGSPRGSDPETKAGIKTFFQNATKVVTGYMINQTFKTGWSGFETNLAGINNSLNSANNQITAFTANMKSNMGTMELFAKYGTKGMAEAPRLYEDLDTLTVELMKDYRLSFDKAQQVAKKEMTNTGYRDYSFGSNPNTSNFTNESKQFEKDLKSKIKDFGLNLGEKLQGYLLKFKIDYSKVDLDTEFEWKKDAEQYTRDLEEARRDLVLKLAEDANDFTIDLQRKRRDEMRGWMDDAKSSSMDNLKSDKYAEQIMKMERILPGLNMEASEFYKTMVSVFDTTGAMGKDMFTEIQEMTKNLLVDPSTLLKIGNTYTKYLKVTTRGQTDFTNKMKKVIDITAKLEDQFVDSDSLFSDIQDFGFSTYEDLSAEQLLFNNMIAKNAGMSIDEYKKLSRTDAGEAAKIRASSMKKDLESLGIDMNSGSLSETNLSVIKERYGVTGFKDITETLNLGFADLAKADEKIKNGTGVSIGLYDRQIELAKEQYDHQMKLADDRYDNQLQLARDQYARQVELKDKMWKYQFDAMWTMNRLKYDKEHNYMTPLQQFEMKRTADILNSSQTYNANAAIQMGTQGSEDIGGIAGKASGLSDILLALVADKMFMGSNGKDGLVGKLGGSLGNKLNNSKLLPMMNKMGNYNPDVVAMAGGTTPTVGTYAASAVPGAMMIGGGLYGAYQGYKNMRDADEESKYGVSGLATGGKKFASAGMMLGGAGAAIAGGMGISAGMTAVGAGGVASGAGALAAMSVGLAAIPVAGWIAAGVLLASAGAVSIIDANKAVDGAAKQMRKETEAKIKTNNDIQVSNNQFLSNIDKDIEAFGNVNRAVEVYTEAGIIPATEKQKVLNAMAEATSNEFYNLQQKGIIDTNKSLSDLGGPEGIINKTYDELVPLVGVDGALALMKTNTETATTAVTNFAKAAVDAANELSNKISNAELAIEDYINEKTKGPNGETAKFGQDILGKFRGIMGGDSALTSTSDTIQYSMFKSVFEQLAEAITDPGEKEKYKKMITKSFADQILDEGDVKMLTGIENGFGTNMRALFSKDQDLGTGITNLTVNKGKVRDTLQGIKIDAFPESVKDGELSNKLSDALTAYTKLTDLTKRDEKLKDINTVLDELNDTERGKEIISIFNSTGALSNIPGIKLSDTESSFNGLGLPNFNQSNVPSAMPGGIPGLPSFAKGSPYIPYDQIAMIHKGERILTAEENNEFGNNITYSNEVKNLASNQLTAAEMGNDIAEKSYKFDKEYYTLEDTNGQRTATNSTALDNVNKTFSDGSDYFKQNKTLSEAMAEVAKYMKSIFDKNKDSKTGDGSDPFTSLGSVSSGYGQRTHPITGQVGKMHYGQDYAIPSGTSLPAIMSGVISKSWYSSGTGNAVELTADNGDKFRYLHLMSPGLAEGSKVKFGDIVGNVGSTGMSNGAHLHLETYKDGKIMNPKDYFANYYNNDSGIGSLFGIHKSGLSNVPYDGYAAILHKDERVLSGSENNLWQTAQQIAMQAVQRTPDSYVDVSPVVDAIETLIDVVKEGFKSLNPSVPQRTNPTPSRTNSILNYT